MDRPGDSATPQVRDRPLLAKRRLLLASSGPAAYLLFLGATAAPGLVETAYGTVIGPAIARVLSTITGIVPFALAEVFILAVVARQAFAGAVALRDVRRGTRRLRNAVQAGALRLAQDAGVLVCLFYVLWGFNYARPSLPQALAWPPVEQVSIAEVSTLAVEMATAANEAYVELHGVDDSGEPTAPSPDERALERALSEGWSAARRELRLPPIGGPFGRAKTPLFTHLYEWLGISGFYFPYTGEANLRAGIPAVDRPQMLAHEKAHQRGVARESEANFWGFLAAARAPDVRARYSAFVFAHRQLAGALYFADEEQWAQVVRQRLPGVQRDIEFSSEYWLQFRGRGTRLAANVNDAFLRSNRVPGGIHSYSLSVLYFIRYARTRGDRLRPEAP